MIEFNREKNLTYRIKTSLWLACSSDFVAYQRNWNWTPEQGLRNKKFTTYAISGYFCVQIMRIGSCWLLDQNLLRMSLGKIVANVVAYVVVHADAFANANANAYEDAYVDLYGCLWGC